VTVAFMMTRANVGNYETWKAMFDQDPPGARRHAKGYRVYRNVDDPGEVFVQVEFATADAAHAARTKLLAAGVLDRFPDHTGPTVVDEAEAVSLG
jgi:hypothetical protein